MIEKSYCVYRHTCNVPDNKYYVYCWYNFDWGAPFYFGKGCGNRYKETKGRSEQFLEIIKCFHCEPHILASGMDEKTALYCERMAKHLKSLGCPLIDEEKEGSAAAQRAGIERAKAEGKYKGRKRIDVDESKFTDEYRRWKNGDTSPKFIMKKLGLKPATFWRRVREYEEKHGIRATESGE